MHELKRLLEYHYWARDRVLDAAAKLAQDDYLRELGGSFASLRDTLVHTYSAEWIWCCRWEGDSPTSMLPGSRFGDLPALRTAWTDHETKLRAVFGRFEKAGFDQEVEYRDIKGNPWSQSFGDMWRHVVNHGSYHRGQVTTLLRQLGAAPPLGMDLITFYREAG